jgi:hypothetical protein
VSCNERRRYILWILCPYYGLLLYSMVFYTKKNLATLVSIVSVHAKIDSGKFCQQQKADVSFWSMCSPLTVGWPDLPNFCLHTCWAINYFVQLSENYRSSPNFRLLFSTVIAVYWYWQKMGWATIWAIFSQTYLATLALRGCKQRAFLNLR